MATEDMRSELDRLRAENDALKRQTARAGSITLRVSEKGGISLYGLGRFPVTVYASQWWRIVDMGDEIKAFIEQNRGRLKVKGE